MGPVPQVYHWPRFIPKEFYPVADRLGITPSREAETELL
jgi:hypothetical protein